MKDFLLLYQGGDPKWMDNASPADMEAMMASWNNWFKELETSGNLRSPGAALVPGGQVLSKKGNGFATDTPMSEVKELVGGYSLIQADSIQKATQIAQGSPHMKNNPDATILVREVMTHE